MPLVVCAKANDEWQTIARDKSYNGDPIVVTLELGQTDLDIRVVFGEEVQTVQNAPLDRALYDFVVLESPETKDLGYEIQVRGKAPSLDGAAQWVPSYRIRDGFNSAQRSAYRNLQQASIAWRSKDRDEWLKADVLIQQALESGELEEKFEQIAMIWSLAILLELEEYARFDDELEAIRTNFEGFEDNARWRSRLLEGESLERRHRYSQAKVIYKDLLNELDIQKSLPPNWLVLREEVRSRYGLSAYVSGHPKLSIGESENLMTVLELALNNAQNLGDDRAIAHAYAALATPYWLQNRFAKAEQLASSAKASYQQAEIDTSFSAVLHNLGLIYLRKGEFQNALTHLRWALSILDQYPDRKDKGYIDLSIANTYRDIGDYDRAVRSGIRAIDRFDTIGNKFGKAKAEIELARILIDSGKELQASTRLAKLLSELSVAGDASLSNLLKESRTELARGELYAGNLTRARSILEASVETASASKESPKPLSKSSLNALLLFMDVFLAENKARNLVGESSASDHAEFLRRAGYLEDKFNVEENPTIFSIEQLIFRSQMARHYLSLNKYTKALSEIKKANVLIESVSEVLDPGYLGLNWANKTRQIFDLEVGALLGEYADSRDPLVLKRLFVQMESSRAKGFRTARRVARTANVIDNEVQIILKKVARAEYDVVNGGQQTRAVQMDESDYLFERYQFKRKAKYSDTTRSTNLNIENLQAVLGDREMILSYHVQKDHSLAYYITKTKWGVLENLQGNNLLSHNISLLNKAIKVKSPRVADALEILSEIFPSKVVRDERIEKIIISPDGPLYSMPFSLFNSGRSEGGFKLGGGQVSISQVYSISDYFSESVGFTGLKEARVDISIFADPAFDVAQIQSEISKVNNEMVRGWSENLTRLPGTAREALAIKARFPSLSVVTVSQGQATTGRLMSNQMRNAKILHIASHGYFDPSTPDIVGIATASEGPATSKVGGFLTLTELLSRPFYSNLIVISGCETGLGKLRGSDGFNSLSRGMLAQGAGSVIGTLWSIPDTPTAIFMELFYGYLVKFDGDASRSLSQTQSDFANGLKGIKLENKNIEGRFFMHPYYWAGFVLTSANQAYDSNVFH